MIAIADTVADGWAHPVITPWPTSRTGTPPAGDHTRRQPGTIHNKGANVLFCDGHVSWYAQKDLINVSGDLPPAVLMRRMWNNDNQP
jgi:prepilin-type processing-associated H-X9-DG protein